MKLICDLFIFEWIYKKNFKVKYKMIFGLFSFLFVFTLCIGEGCEVGSILIFLGY